MPYPHQHRHYCHIPLVLGFNQILSTGMQVYPLVGYRVVNIGLSLRLCKSTHTLLDLYENLY